MQLLWICSGGRGGENVVEYDSASDDYEDSLEIKSFESLVQNLVQLKQVISVRIKVNHDSVHK